MELKPRLKKQLEAVREVSEGLLKSFETPEQWTHQVHPVANHALWFAGHMGSADNYFISMIDPSRVQDKEGYNEMFGTGSQPKSDPSAYPPVDEVLAYMRERRQTLLSVLDGLSDADLAKMLPEGTPPIWTDQASVVEMAVWHEALHAGQVTIARRAIGHKPLF